MQALRGGGSENAFNLYHLRKKKHAYQVCFRRVGIGGSDLSYKADHERWSSRIVSDAKAEGSVHIRSSSFNQKDATGTTSFPLKMLLRKSGGDHNYR